jgi:hypothetical protein
MGAGEPFQVGGEFEIERRSPDGGDVRERARPLGGSEGVHY